MIKPKSVEYFFVGPPKTGTTWLYSVFENTEDVNLSNHTKELEFFNKNFDKGFSWYHRSFHNSGKIKCDISTSYFTSEKALSRIKKYNPQAKIIITIRNPVNRFISHYKHNIRFGIIKKIPINEAIIRHANLIENSLYAKYVRKWIDNFGKENVLILPLELLGRDPDKYIKLLGSFLNVKIELDHSKTSNRINYASQPKSYFLARYTRIIRKTTNSLGLHGLVRIAKKLGIKKLIYEGGKEIVIGKSSIDSLSNLFVSDLQELKKYNIPEEILNDYLKHHND